MKPSRVQGNDPGYKPKQSKKRTYEEISKTRESNPEFMTGKRFQKKKGNVGKKFKKGKGKKKR